MISITKQEKNKLLDMGCKWYEDIHKSHSKHPKYYLTESKINLKKLETIRKR